jgi:hypothetical protein
MVLENLPSTRASRSRRPRVVWPALIAVIALAGAVGGVMFTSR